MFAGRAGKTDIELEIRIRMPRQQLLHVLRLDRAKLNPVHIFEQLRLEEALYRANDDNWIVVNDGGNAIPHPSVVLGISGKPTVMCDVSRVERESVPLFRRFTGGGTVVVGRGTTFISLIGNKSMLPPKDTRGPRELMRWSGKWYSNALEECGVDVKSMNNDEHTFALRENDYVLGNRKFAGNAQGLSRTRFVHHTSVLWNYKKQDMKLLQNPTKQPEYRAKREHEDFLIPLSETMSNRESLPNALIAELSKSIHFDELIEIDPDDSIIQNILLQDHHKSNTYVNTENEKIPNWSFNVQKRWL